LLAAGAAPVTTTEGPAVSAGTRLDHAPPGAPGRPAHALAARPAGPPHAAAPPAAPGSPALVPTERPAAARPPQDAALCAPVVPGRLDSATATMPEGTLATAKMALREPAGTPPDQKMASCHPLRRARTGHRWPLRRPHLASPHRIYRFRPSVLLLLPPPPPPPGSPCASCRYSLERWGRKAEEAMHATRETQRWHVGNQCVWGRSGNSVVISGNCRGKLVRE
jgi:hypothetical protein